MVLSINIAGGVIFSLLTAFGVCLHILLLFVFFRGRKFFMRRPFYVLSCQIVSANFFLYITAITTVIPERFLPEEIFDCYRQHVLYEVFLRSENFGFYLLVLTALAMSWNRYKAACWRRQLNNSDQRFLTEILLTAAAIWIISIGFTVYEFRHCPKINDQYRVNFFKNCSTVPLYRNIMYCGFILIPLAIFVVYLLAYVEIKKPLVIATANISTVAHLSDENHLSALELTPGCEARPLSTAPAFISRIQLRLMRNQLRMEYSILIQAVIICVSIEIIGLCLTVFPFLAAQIKEPITSQLLKVIQNCLIIVSCMTQPFVYFVFNMEVRKHLFKFLDVFGYCGNYIKAIGPVSVNPVRKSCYESAW